eukprot:161184_1
MCFSASENLVGNLHCASLIVCNFRFFDIYDHSSIFSRLSIMGTYFSRILLPSSAIITQQIWNIIQFKIHQKITLKNTSNETEILIDVPSSLQNVINDKIKNAMDTQHIVPIHQGNYDMFYMIAPEIDNFFSFDTIINFFNAYGRPITLRKDMSNYLEEIGNDEQEKNRFEKIMLFCEYCSVFEEQLKQPQIKTQIKLVRAAKRKKNRLPPTIQYKDFNIMPKSCVLLEDMLIGFDVRSKTNDKMGRLKIVLNSIKYNITNDKITGKSSLLDTYYTLEDDEIVKELAAHPLFDPKHKKKSYHPQIDSNASLKRERNKTAKLKRTLSGLRADPSFLYF